MNRTDDVTIPDSWEEVYLAEVLIALESGKRPKGGVQGITKGIPSIGGEHLNSCGGFNFENIKFVPGYFAEKLIRARLNLDDILVVKDGATTGKISYINDIFPFEYAVVNEHIFICRCVEQINNKYIFYFLFSQAGNKQILADFRGAAQGGISRAFIDKALVPIAPLNEQHRIVAKIEALKARSQQVKEALEAIPPLLDQFRQSVLAAAFRGDLTADWRQKNSIVTPAKELLERSDKETSSVLPFTWNLASVGDVVESLKYGTSQKCSYDTEGVPVLRIPNVSNGTIDRSDLKFAKLPVKEFEELKLIPGDILIIRSNGSVSLVGKSAIVGKSEKNLAYAGYLIRLRPNKFLIDSNYLNLCLSSYDVRLQIEIPARSTSGVHNINSQEVKQLKISLPPIEEQLEIFYRVQTLFKAADQVKQQSQEAKAYLDQLDQSILAKAFRGELVPQDPSDEPASVLLERIRAERAKREAEAKTAKKSTGKTTGQRSRKAKQQDLESIQLGLPGLE